MELDTAQAAQGVPVEPERLSDWRRYCRSCRVVQDVEPVTLLDSGRVWILTRCCGCGYVLAKAEAK